jgi:hypothetical protein
MMVPVLTVRSLSAQHLFIMDDGEGTYVRDDGPRLPAIPRQNDKTANLRVGHRPEDS